MEFAARYHNGQVAEVRAVICRLDPARRVLVIADLASAEVYDSWPLNDLFGLPSRFGEVRLGVDGRPFGARLGLNAGYAEARRVRALFPQLQLQEKQERFKQFRILGLATGALLAVIFAYIVGVPLIAGQIVGLVPWGWEEQFGDTAADQIAGLLSEGEGFQLCDPNPDSLANRAIARFTAVAMADTGSPFTPQIAVVKSDIANAFALPGGKMYYFSAMLDASETPDEFAGVLAHELGHVYYRHGMQQLIATSATGLLIGFVLGDMTGLSVASGIGTALIDTKFSREAERDADAFAGRVARRMAFKPSALASLLERVAQDDGIAKALALFSSHPLTTERRIALEAMTAEDGDLKPAFSATEWQAITSMCGKARWSGVRTR